MQTTFNKKTMMINAIIPSNLMQVLQENHRHATRNDGHIEPVVHLYLPGTKC